MVRRIGLTIALAASAATISVAPAFGAATRTEYAAQANAICAVAFPQYEAVARDVVADSRRLEGKKAAKIKPKKGKKLMRAMIRGYQTLTDIARNENLQLATLVAAPGDESLVAAWLAARNEVVRLSDVSIDQFRELVRLVSGKPKLKDILKLFGLFAEMEATSKQLTVKIKEAGVYGGQLGTTTCGSQDILLRSPELRLLTP
jgi:hypothetical protein